MSEMRKCRKTAFALSLVIVLTLTISGCSASGGKITSPQNMSFLVKNNLETEMVAEDLDKGSGEYLQVSGLKDKDVEKAVNEKLYETYAELRDKEELPPYRGIRQKIKDDCIETSRHIYTLLGANVNNVLSAYVMESITRESPAGDFYSYSDVKTVNIDLNTGDEILLGDLFCDDVDHEEYINRYVEESSFGGGDVEAGYYPGENALKLTAPFEGINEEQKFYINEYDGSICLIFDYENPEIYCEYDSPVFFKVAPGKNSALGSRYYSKKGSLYETEAKNCILLSRPFDPAKAVVEETSVMTEGNAEAAHISVYSMYYEDMPAGALKYAKEHCSPSAEMIQSYTKSLNGYRDVYGVDEVFSDAMYNMDCSRFSNLTNVETRFYSVTNNSEGSVLAYREDNVYSCFRDAEYRPLKIEDIFVSKVDAKAAVTGAFMKNYEEYLETEGGEDLYAGKDQMQRFFEEAYDKIDGFIVLGSFVVYSYDGWELLLDKYFPGEENWIYGSFCEMTEYDDLGTENLIFFK